MAPGSFSLPTLLWLQRHRPEVLQQTHKLLVPSGFINCQLTGTFTIDPSRLCTTMLGDIRTGQWSPDMLALSGLPEAILPEVHDAWDVVGYVTRDAAGATGLAAGTPVVAGVMDTVAASVGAACAVPGHPFSIVGTTGRISVTLDQPVFDPRFVNSINERPGR